MKHFFNADNFYWKCFDKLADVLILSLMWFLCSLPMVTVGAASTALYDCAARCVRGGDPQLYRRFFRTFRESFKPAALCTLIWGGALVLLGAGHQIAADFARENPPMAALSMAYYVLRICAMGYLSWLFPLLSRYEFTFRDLCRTAVQFWFVHFPATLAMAVLLQLSVGLTVQLLFPVCFLPALLALADSFFVERAFRKHMPTEPEEAPAPDSEP